MMKKAKMKIKKIVIEIAGKDIELTLDEAKELQEALNDLFETKQVLKPFIPRVPEPVWPWPTSPDPWIRPWKPDRPKPMWEITCGSDTAFFKQNS